MYGMYLSQVEWQLISGLIFLSNLWNSIQYWPEKSKDFFLLLIIKEEEEEEEEVEEDEEML